MLGEGGVVKMRMVRLSLRVLSKILYLGNNEKLCLSVTTETVY